MDPYALNLEAAILNVSLLWLLTVPHEYAHAWVAEKLGDDTPGLEGRVTLHPMAHVDWIGTVLLPALTSLFGMGFLGWGKPVNTNPARLRFGLNGLALVAMAGPASNLVFAVVLAAVSVALSPVVPIASEFFANGVFLSLYLAIFNLIPVPPLDGSKLLLAARIPLAVYQEIARAGFLIVIVLMSATGLGRWMSLWAFSTAQGIFGIFR